MSELVTVERDDAEAGADVAVVTLKIPAKRNALSLDLREALFQALDTLTADATCRAIVLTGAGGTFCAGG
ncbi:MAG TPA: enoyl-CoA hydratase/isomerase family protein, partial [Stellaceae bacterium]